MEQRLSETIKQSLLLISVLFFFFGSIVLISTANASEIQCCSYGSSSYPTNGNAIKLGKHLRVTTCDGKMFQGAVKQLEATYALVGDCDVKIIEAVENVRSIKRAKRLSKKLKGFSL